MEGFLRAVSAVFLGVAIVFAVGSLAVALRAWWRDMDHRVRSWFSAAQHHTPPPEARPPAREPERPRQLERR